MPTTVGFSTSSVGTEADWARVAALFGAPFVVESDTALQPTAVTTADRTVRINQGTGRILGLRTQITGSETVQVPVNNTGTVRLDAVVLRTVWASAFGQAARTTVLTVVPGSGAGFPPTMSRNGTPAADVINWQPGVVYDAVVAFVETGTAGGALSTGNIFDVRLRGTGGVLRYPQTGYLSFVDVPLGARLEGADGSQWVNRDDGINTVFSGRKQYRSPVKNDGGNPYIVLSGVGSQIAGGVQLTPELDYRFTPVVTGPARISTRIDAYAIEAGFGFAVLQVTLGSPGLPLSGDPVFTDFVVRDGIPNWADMKVVRNPILLNLTAGVEYRLGIFAKNQNNAGKWGVSSVMYVVDQGGLV